MLILFVLFTKKICLFDYFWQLQTNNLDFFDFSMSQKANFDWSFCLVKV